MYQSFEEAAAPAASGERVKALQRELKSRRLKGFLVPHSDEHQDEFLSPAAERLAWLTGFTGSAGVAIVLDKAAALFVDGRYILQARAQADPALFEVLQTPEAKASSWLKEKLGKGAAIGYDPALHTIREIERLGRDLGQERNQARARGDQPDRPVVGGAAEAFDRPHRAARARIFGAKRQRQDPRRAGHAQGREHRRGAAHHARFDRLAVQHPRRRHQAYAGRARLCHRAGERPPHPVHRRRQGRRQCAGRVARLRRHRRTVHPGREAHRARPIARAGAARSRYRADALCQAARGGRRQVRSRRRSLQPAQGGQERG